MPETSENVTYSNYMMNLRLMYPTADNELKKITILNGASLLQFNERVNTDPKSCTLIISIGGAGFRALNTIKKKYNVELNEASLPMKKRRVRFLAIDTDNSANNGLTSVSTSSNNGQLSADELCCIWKDDAKTGLVGVLTHDDCTLPQTKWFDKRIPSTTKLDNCGAQGMRQIGRLMLSIKANYEHVYNCVNNIFKDFTEIGGIENTRVIFVCGISGGTGSGCVIDTAYLVRRAAKAQAPNGMNAQFDAFVFTPEIHRENIVSGEISEPDVLYRNFTACLKEIDTLMASDENKYGYSFPSDMFPDGNAGITHDDKIFESCTIVDARSNKGHNLPRSEVMSTLADYIIDMVSNIDYTDPSDGSQKQMLGSILNNEMSMEAAIHTLITSQPNMPRNVRYRYRAVGFKAVTFPIDEIMNFFSSSVLQRIRMYMFSPSINDRCKQKAYELMMNLRLYPEGGAEPTPMDIERLFAKGNNPAKYSFISSRLSVTSTGNGKTYRTSKPYFCQPDYDTLKKALNSDPTTNVEYDSSWIENDMNIIMNAFSDMMNGRYTDKDGNMVVDIMNAGPYAAMQLGKELINVINKLLNVFINEGSAKSFEYLDGTHKQKGQAYANIVTSIQQGKVKRQDMEVTMKRAENMVKESASIYLKKEHHPEAIQALNKLKAAIETYTRNNWECICNIFSGMTDALRNDAEAVIRASGNTADGVIDISKLGAEPKTDKQRKLDDLYKYFVDDRKICTELLGKMYSSIEADLGQWSFTDNQNFVLPDTIQKVLSEYFMMLKGESQSLQGSDILQRLLFILNTPLDPRMSIDEIFKLFRDKFAPDLPGTLEYKWEQVEHHFHALFSDREQPLDIAKTDIYNQLVGLGFCAKVNDKLIAQGIDFDNFPTFDMLIMTDRAKFLSDKLSAMFPGPSPAKATSRDNAGYAMFKFRFYLPLYTFDKMEFWQDKYLERVDSTSSVNAGIHQSVDGWKDFQPIINLDSLFFLNHGALNETQLNEENAVYNREITIFDKIKDMTDRAINDYETIHYIEDNVVPYYELEKISTETTLQDTKKKVLEKYRTQLQAVVDMVDAKEADIFDGADEMSDEELTAAFGAQYDKIFDDTMKEYGKSISGRLADEGYKTERQRLKMGKLCSALDQTKTTDYKSGPNEGGLYKLIRISPYFRKELEKMDKYCAEIKDDMDKEKVLFAPQKQAWVNKAVATVKTGNDDVLRKKQEGFIDLFEDCYATGHIVMDYDSDTCDLTFYYLPDINDPENPEFLLDNDELTINLYGATYESTFKNYCLFLYFMRYMQNLDKDSLDAVKDQIRADSIQMVRTSGVSTIKAKKAELLEYKRSTNPVQLKKDITEFNNQFENKAPVAFTSIELDGTKLDATKTGRPSKMFGDNGNSFYGQVSAFYSKIEEDCK